MESAITVVLAATNDSCTSRDLCGRRIFYVSVSANLMDMSTTTFLQENLWNIDPGPDCPAIARMVVEIGKYSSNKYEYDPRLRLFRLDRALYSPLHYPGDYGFIPGTIAEDGEPIDILCLVEQASFPGCLLSVRPVGMLDMLEESTYDHKILAVPARSPRYEQIHSVEDVRPHIVTEVRYFFEIYKELEAKKVEMKGWQGVEAARAAIAESRSRYLESQPAEHA